MAGIIGAGVSGDSVPRSPLRLVCALGRIELLASYRSEAMSSSTNRGLLVVNYPTLPAMDLATIQATRKIADRLYYEVVAPHFTFVFPTFTLTESALIDHVTAVIAAMPAFDFVIRCAVLGDDAFSDNTHVFLVPDEGYSQIVRLHDRLYTDILAPVCASIFPLFRTLALPTIRIRRCVKQFAIAGMLRNLPCTDGLSRWT
jgi:hypothetical protein